MRAWQFLIIAVAVVWITPVHARVLEGTDWRIDIGARWFKYSAEGGPNEIGYNPVFKRWENIKHDSSQYNVSSYRPLEPLYFNMNFGMDFFIRYGKYLLIKPGYDYSNPFGIGGSGRIAYTDSASGSAFKEKKTFSYTSHQINLFVGPAIPIEDVAEIYMGFSPMAPTWVIYKESYSLKKDGVQTEHYNRTFKGFFGSCRALVGMQVPVVENFHIGAEMVFAFLNYMKLTSGDLKDHSFRFPLMKWNVVFRYTIM